MRNEKKAAVGRQQTADTEQSREREFAQGTGDDSWKPEAANGTISVR